jgi:DNA-binding transcriptional LysR family regulator
MSQADTSEVVQGIALHKADIGFAGSMLGEKKCDFYEYTNENLVFIAPNNGVWSKNIKHTLEELLYSNNFISREFGSGTRMQYEKYFTENGIILDKIKTCANMDSTHSIINAVISGLGISIVSELAVRQTIKQKLLLPIKVKNETPERKIYAVLNKNIVHSHLIKLFMQYTTEKAQTRASASN